MCFETFSTFQLGDIVSNFNVNKIEFRKHHKSKLKKSNIVEFESFPFEVLQIFGDYIYRVGRTLTVLELVQFFEFCHFLGLERVCKGQGSPNLQNNFVINGTILGRSEEPLIRYNF